MKSHRLKIKKTYSLVRFDSIKKKILKKYNLYFGTAIVYATINSFDGEIVVDVYII